MDAAHCKRFGIAKSQESVGAVRGAQKVKAQYLPQGLVHCLVLLGLRSPPLAQLVL